MGSSAQHDLQLDLSSHLWICSLPSALSLKSCSPSAPNIVSLAVAYALDIIVVAQAALVCY